MASLTKRSSSLEFIELIPASLPSLDTSLTDAASQPQESRLEGEKEGEDGDGGANGTGEPAQQQQQQQQGGSHATGPSGKRPTSFLRLLV